MFSAVSMPILLGVFLAAAGIVWWAGIWLSNTTDVFDDRFRLGEALGGLIILSITTNLPEMAITVTAALHHDLGLAIGNILGGIAVQTVVLVILDVWGAGKTAGLTYRAASLQLVLEGVMLLAILVVVIMGSQFPPTFHFARMTPASLLIALIWITGLWLISKSRKGLPWQEKGEAPDNEKSQPPAPEAGKRQRDGEKLSTRHAFGIFAVAALATLAAGYALEQSGEALARHVHMTGVLFGATVLAAATAIPEISTGLQSARAGGYQLAFSDIFGGNAFLPVLFLVADLISGQAVLPQAKNSDIYLTGLGALLTAVYLVGLIFRPKSQIFGMGVDSFLVLILYVLGAVGLVALAR